MLGSGGGIGGRGIGGRGWGGVIGMRREEGGSMGGWIGGRFGMRGWMW